MTSPFLVLIAYYLERELVICGILYYLYLLYLLSYIVHAISPAHWQNNTIPLMHVANFSTTHTFSYQSFANCVAWEPFWTTINPTKSTPTYYISTAHTSLSTTGRNIIIELNWFVSCWPFSSMGISRIRQSVITCHYGRLSITILIVIA